MLPPNNKPVVQLLGETEHPDFRDAVALVRGESRLVVGGEMPPDVVIVAQSRPDVMGREQLDRLRRAAPLAGVVALAGSWCEGETRTGRPWPGIRRLYWYEFPAWWQRQMQLRTAGRCPDWARPANFGFPAAAGKLLADSRLLEGEPGRAVVRAGLVVLHTSNRATADAVADSFRQAGYSTVWQPPGRPRSVVRGAIAGVWDGGQLSDDESTDLAAFCAALSYEGAPIVVLLDFPRRDCVDRAMEIGAAAVLGKPWMNAELVSTIGLIASQSQISRAA